ncbi:MAG: hypothetical protein MJY89_04250 [Bacteroidales bacterium]|nr:hypothetical protein [Bacteroidales bacterium]
MKKASTFSVAVCLFSWAAFGAGQIASQFGMMCVFFILAGATELNLLLKAGFTTGTYPRTR